MAAPWVVPPAEGLVRVAVCEEHALFRRGMVVGLERDPQAEVVAETGSAEELLGNGLVASPEAVLLDLGVCHDDVGDVVAGILDRCPHAAVLLAVSDETDPLGYVALRAGAIGVLHKDVAVATGAEAVRAVRAGNVLLNAHLASRLLAEYGELAGRGRAGQAVPVLTEDEGRLLALIADGSPATAVAVAARLPASTARNLVRNAVLKLQRHVATRPAPLAV